MSKLTILLGGITFLSGILAGRCYFESQRLKEEIPIPSPPSADRYSDGVNNALRAFVLLNLEQEMEGTRRNYGDMSAIVCERLSVKFHDPRVEPEKAKK